MTHDLHQTAEQTERLFLVGIQTSTMSRAQAEASLDELVRLADSTDGEIVGSTLIRVRQPRPATYIPSGAIDELAGELAALDVRTVVLDEDVTATQQRNLEERWKPAKVLMRSELILDLFARRAQTSEGKLQIELAQHQYRLPRLRGFGAMMSRIGGGIGARGPGEKELEVDRRAIMRRIQALDEKILRLRMRRETQRARRGRSTIPTVALVGYTNAGKSTLLNSLTGADAFVEDKLFATLDPTARRCRLDSGMSVVVTDTVGFINRLPTQLAAAFRATLEEVLYADVLVHVVDATSPRAEHEIEVTRNVLAELGASAIPRLTVWNKIDALEEALGAGAPTPGFIEAQHPGTIAISALERTGLDRLGQAIEDLINEARPEAWLRFDYDSYADVARIEAAGAVHEIHHLPDGIWLRASLPPDLARRFEKQVVAEPPSELAGLAAEQDGAESGAARLVAKRAPAAPSPLPAEED